MRSLTSHAHPPTLPPAEFARAADQHFEPIAALVAAYGEMLGALDPEALLPAIVEQSRRSLVADAYALWRHDPSADEWRVSASSGLSDDYRCHPLRFPSGATQPDSVAGYLLEPIAVSNTASSGPEPLLADRRELYEKEGIRALLVVPLQLHGERTATIVYYYRTVREFTEGDVRAATAFASLASSALASAELYAAEKRARSEAEAAHREAELLYRAGALLSRTLDPREVYDTARELIAGNLVCDSFIVSNFDPATETISCAYAWVEGTLFDPATLPPVPLAPPGRGIQSDVIRSAQPSIVQDVVERSSTNSRSYHVHGDGRIQSEPDPTQPRSHSMLLVPIILERRVLGVVQIQSHRERAYTDRDMRLLEAMVLQMAAAARNAFLYQQAQAEIAQRRQAEEERARHLEEIRTLNARLQRAMTETHHRVKNNLQIMAAMVDMQVLEANDSVPASELERLATHIRTLAVIHEILTERTVDDAGANTETISARAVLERLLPRLRNVGEYGTRELRFRIDDALLTSRQGTSLALVTNELVSNAVKYGRSAVEVAFRAGGGSACLTVDDDGPGFAADFEPSLAANTGLELVESLSRWDLGGAARYENRPGGGGRVVVEFPAASGSA